MTFFANLLITAKASDAQSATTHLRNNSPLKRKCPICENSTTSILEEHDVGLLCKVCSPLPCAECKKEVTKLYKAPNKNKYICKTCTQKYPYYSVCHISGEFVANELITKEGIYFPYDLALSSEDHWKTRLPVHSKDFCKTCGKPTREGEKKCLSCETGHICAGCEKLFDLDKLNHRQLCRTCENNLVYCLGCGVEHFTPSNKIHCSDCSNLISEGKCVQCKQKVKLPNTIDETGHCDNCRSNDTHKVYYCANHCGYRGVSSPDELCPDCALQKANEYRGPKKKNRWKI